MPSVNRNRRRFPEAFQYWENSRLLGEQGSAVQIQCKKSWDLTQTVGARWVN
jgi:hypothetical protein